MNDPLVSKLQTAWADVPRSFSKGLIMKNLNVEKTPTIISDIARFTSRKFIVVLMFLSLRTTRQTSEFPSKFTTTMTEHREITALLTMLTTIDEQ